MSSPEKAKVVRVPMMTDAETLKIIDQNRMQHPFLGMYIDKRKQGKEKAKDALTDVNFEYSEPDSNSTDEFPKR